MKGTTASVRRARSSCGASGPVLPEELVVWEILVRLPARLLLRRRAVCRTSDPAFLLAHHRRQPSLPLVAFYGQFPAGSQNNRHVFVDALDLRSRRGTSPERRPLLRFDDYNFYRGFNVHASCDGLLLLSLSDHRLYVCNPATRQWASLARATAGADGATLYHHASSAEYRVVYWKGGPYYGRDAIYHVVTVGAPAAAEPRRVEAAATLSPFAKRLVTKGWMEDSDRPSAFQRGCVHWLLHASPEKALAVLDTEAESFRTMPFPVASLWLCERPQLLVADGALAVSLVDERRTTMKLWVLHDYEAGVWTLMRRIVFPLAEMRTVVRVPRRFYHGTVVSEDGDDALLHCLDSFYLFHSDMEGEVVRKFCWNGAFPRPAVQWFREERSQREPRQA